MPILDIQAGFATTFRIRLGAMVVGRSGKKAPKHLNGALRITSPAPEAVHAFTDVYGGEVSPWTPDDGRKEWQAILDTNVLPVVILPGSSLIQWWELFDSGGCVRRCDGLQQVVDHGARPLPCQCPQPPETRMGSQPRGTAPDRLWCKPTTQVLVVVPTVDVAGAGRLVSRGLIAAKQLPSALAIAEGMLDRGYRVPAYLRITHHAGRRDYVVPQLDLIGVGLTELDGGAPLAAVGRQAPALPTGRAELMAAPSPPSVPPPTDYGDYGSPDRPELTLPNPSGDVGPSMSGAMSGGQRGTEAETGRGQASVTAAGPRPPAAPDPGRPFTDDDETLIPFAEQRDFARELSTWTRERFPGPGITKTTEAVRHAVVVHVTGNPKRSSSKGLLMTELPKLYDTFTRLKDGRLDLDIADDGAIVITLGTGTGTLSSLGDRRSADPGLGTATPTPGPEPTDGGS